MAACKRSAYLALVREEFDGDIHGGLRDMRYPAVEFQCDDGILIVERER